MKLLKLVYIAHGWYLGYKGERLIYDPVCAWPYGPVIPELYFQINRYGGNPITARITLGLGSPNEPRFNLDDATTGFLDTILKHYNKYSAFGLSALTHQKGTPWHQVTKNYSSEELKKNRSIRIPTEMIRDYYKAKIEAININEQ